MQIAPESRDSMFKYISRLPPPRVRRLTFQTHMLSRPRKRPSRPSLRPSTKKRNTLQATHDLLLARRRKALLSEPKTNSVLPRHFLLELGTNLNAWVVDLSSRPYNVPLRDGCHASLVLTVALAAHRPSDRRWPKAINLKGNSLSSDAGRIIMALRTDRGERKREGDRIVASPVVEVNLSQNRIGDDASKEIARHVLHTSIELLDLSDNYIGPKGGTSLAEVLMEETQKRSALGLPPGPLKCLRVKSCNLRNQGAVGLASAVFGIRHLEELDLSWNAMTFKGLVDVINAVSKHGSLKRLLLRGAAVEYFSYSTLDQDDLSTSSRRNHNRRQGYREASALLSETGDFGWIGHLVTSLSSNTSIRQVHLPHVRIVNSNPLHPIKTFRSTEDLINTNEPSRWLLESEVNKIKAAIQTRALLISLLIRSDLKAFEFPLEITQLIAGYYLPAIRVVAVFVAEEFDAFARERERRVKRVYTRKVLYEEREKTQEVVGKGEGWLEENVLEIVLGAP